MKRLLCTIFFLPVIYRSEFKCHTKDKRGRFRYFSPSVEKYIELKNEKEGYLCKQVQFDGKTHVTTTLERQKTVVK